MTCSNLYKKYNKQMRVIKHLKRQTPEEKLKRFFMGLTIVTKVLLVLLTIMAIFIALSNSIKLTIFNLFSMRFTEVILFVLMGLSDLKREEGKGSYYLIMSFTIKTILLLTLHKVALLILPSWPQFDIFFKTSIPIQFLFIITVEDAFATPQNLKYLFIQPFQIKAKFYPLFIFLILMISGLRVDLLIPFFIGLICHFAKINQLFTTLSTKLDQKYLTERMQEVGFLKTGSHERSLKPLDELNTNDSIYLEEK